MFIPAWLTHSFYIGVFIGVITLGEAALIPAISLGHIGTVSLSLILAIAFIGTVLADAFWYSLGYFVPQEKLMQYRFVQRRMNRAAALTEFFRKHRLRLVFYSKFLYSTRIVFQLLAGATRTPFFMYLLVNALSTALWLFVLTMIGVLLGRSIDQFRDVVFGVEVVVTISGVLIVVLYFVGNWLLRHLINRWK